MRTSLLAVILLAPVLPGCAVAAGAAVCGVVQTTTALENQHYAIIDGRSSVVWTSAKSTLAGMATLPIETLEETMQARASIDYHKVVVTVKTYDLDKSQIFVEALQIGIPSKQMASEVLARIVNDFSDR